MNNTEKRNWRVIAYDEHDSLVLDTVKREMTESEVNEWAKAHPDYDNWSRFSVSKAP